mgnify:CR=1 FL=1
MPEQAAFEALVDLARRSKRSAKDLPAQVDIKPHWSGVGFSLMGHHLVAPMGSIAEMLEVPSYTRLPGVQPWVRGVANVRGRLLPLFDMAAFFGGRLSGHRKRRRVLVLDMGEVYTGLVVDQVLGMQHFPVDAFSAAAGDIDSDLQAFASGSYQQQDGPRWTVFNPAELGGDARFANAAKT